MGTEIADAILREAQKLVARHQRYAFDLNEHLNRCQARSGIARPKVVKLPDYWECNPGFNPYYVRSHANSFAYAIERALKAGTYQPRPPILYSVAKPGGGLREVCVFQVPDQAVAHLVFRRLLEKNSPRFSSRCFAYRRDLTVHDAVLHLASNFSGKRRLFIAEYDFKKYFDSLSHAHVKCILEDKRFCITQREKHILLGFQKYQPQIPGSYSLDRAPERVRGIPQGVSTSLFLANAAAYPLDRELEKLRVDFARYADDTIIWSEDYSELCRAVDVLADAATQMGVDLNLQKSDGVSILVEKDATAEMKGITYVDFVGYRISSHSIGIRDKTVSKIKERISYLIYANLLQPLKLGHFRTSIVRTIDRDYFVLIAQLRRYLYGDLTEDLLAKYLSKDVPKMHYKGLMSFFPIVDDEEQLKELDGWLVHTVFTSIRRRTQLLRASGIVAVLPPPHGMAKEDLCDSSLGILRLPSFLRIAKLLRKAATAYGASAIAAPEDPSS